MRFQLLITSSTLLLVLSLLSPTPVSSQGGTIIQPPPTACSTCREGLMLAASPTCSEIINAPIPSPSPSPTDNEGFPEPEDPWVTFNKMTPGQQTCLCAMAATPNFLAPCLKPDVCNPSAIVQRALELMAQFCAAVKNNNNNNNNSNNNNTAPGANSSKNGGQSSFGSWSAGPAILAVAVAAAAF